MTLYCDRLSVRAALAVLRLRLRVRISRVAVLDPMRGATVATAILRAAGIGVEEARFFAGHLKTADGEAVYVAARRETTRLAFEAADVLIAESAALRDADADAGRGTLRLFLARILWRDIEPDLARVLAAQALEGSATCTVLLQRPLTYPPRVLTSACRGTRFWLYGPRIAPVQRARLMWRAIVSSVGRELRWMLPWARRGTAPAPRRRPGVLLIQEDDLSMDRSHRSQPHWLFPDTPRPDFDTYVLPQSRAARLPTDDPALAAAGVHALDESELTATRRPVEGSPVDRRLGTRARALALAALTARRTSTAVAAASAWGLFIKARSLAAWCAHWNIRAYLTAENYPVQSDAMQIVAHHTGVTTISYQYSNLAFATPLMMTTADRLVLFSRTFTPLWTSYAVAPGRLEYAGYVFDRAFALVRPRAEQLRRQLESQGATFVLCYFDESVQADKYGLIGDADHLDELHHLARALLDDPSLGLVVKTQFERNSPSRRYAGDPTLERARATGRYVELRHGVHRNTVFPAEAALAADFCIGHIVGATAALEAALAGRRCALLNPYGMRSFADDLYAQVSVISHSTRDLLNDIAAMRRGDGAVKDFGDWAPILPQMDAHRDGRAADRLRRMLDEIVSGATVQSGAA